MHCRGVVTLLWNCLVTLFSKVHTVIFSKGKQSASLIFPRRLFTGEWHAIPYLEKQFFSDHFSLSVFYITGSHLALLSVELTLHHCTREVEVGVVPPVDPPPRTCNQEGAGKCASPLSVSRGTWSGLSGGEESSRKKTNIPALPFNLRDGDRFWERNGKRGASGNREQPKMKFTWVQASAFFP